MLKIKEGIDLRTLKKFGFKNEEKYNYYKYNNEKGTIYYVFKGSRTISTTVDEIPSHYLIHDKIYELINAGLIEKCEDGDCRS